MSLVMAPIVSGNPVSLSVFYVPFVGAIVEASSLNFYRKQRKTIINRVDEGGLSKMNARISLKATLELRSQILQAGLTRSLITIAICLGCFALGFFPILSAAVAIGSLCSYLAVREGLSIDQKIIAALENKTDAGDALLKKMNLGAVV